MIADMDEQIGRLMQRWVGEKEVREGGREGGDVMVKVVLIHKVTHVDHNHYHHNLYHHHHHYHHHLNNIIAITIIIIIAL
jgi:hypothetical protein